MRETWIVTDGAVGMEAQGIAVAEAVGLPYTLKRVKPAGLMRLIPIRFQHLVPAEGRIAASESSSPLAPPWPRRVISIGRRSVPLALAIEWVGGAYGSAYPKPERPCPPVRFDCRSGDMTISQPRMSSVPSAPFTA